MLVFLLLILLLLILLLLVFLLLLLLIVVLLLRSLLRSLFPGNFLYGTWAGRSSRINNKIMIMSRRPIIRAKVLPRTRYLLRQLLLL